MDNQQKYKLDIHFSKLNINRTRSNRKLYIRFNLPILEKEHEETSGI